MAEQEQLNIYQKLAKIRKQVEVIQKNKRGYGYTYVSEEEILAKITVFMDKYHLSLVPGIVGGTTKVEPYPYKKTKTTKGGEIYEENVNEVLVSADMTWTWVNNDNPEEKVVVGWTLVGQQSDASQAFGSGLTYSDRYFLLKYFNVATTDDDPDAHRSKQRAAWEAFLGGTAASPVPQTVCEPKPEEPPKLHVDTSMRMNRFSLSFSGDINVDMIANSLKHILGGNATGQVEIVCSLVGGC